MNIIEKARQYVRRHKKQNDYERLTWGDVYNAYIQGHKDAYIESVHEQHFKTSEYMPPAEPGKKHNTVWVLSGDEFVYYDYNEKMWYTEQGMPTHVEIWTWPPALAVEEEEPEKTAHQFQEELKQAQYEKQQMENQFVKVIETFEELLTDQFSICELRDVWRKRAGLVQKCEEWK